jgi:hypothetical protein
LTLQSDTPVQRPIPSSIDTLFALVVLALPFVIATIALHGLSDHIQTFHGSDEEIFHYPLIRKFIATFPKMDLSDYPSATTPLYHVFSATIGKLVSSDIRVLRAANVLITYASAVALFALFQREIMTGWLTSLLVALTMVLSPYVFGNSFLLMTDNLAMLFAIGAIWCAMRYLRTGQWDMVALAALLACCAIMTRQFYLWLLITILVASVARKLERPAEGALFGALVLTLLALAPVVVLCVLWGGFTPPQFQFYTASTLRIAPLAFLTATLGMYSAPFLVLSACNVSRLSLQARNVARMAVVVLTSAVLLWFGQLHYVREVVGCNGAATCMVTDGYLWRLSQLFPSIGQTSLLFCVLVPLGIVALLCVPRNKAGLFAITIFMSFGFFSISQVSLFQKYYDVPALLVICLIFTGIRSDRIVQAVLSLYCVGFVAYAVTAPYHSAFLKGAN